MTLNEKLRLWGPVTFVLVLIFILSTAWYLTFPPSAWGITPNYLQMYIDFIASRPFDAFLSLNTGPGEIISWLFIPAYLAIAAHIALHYLGIRVGREYNVVNRRYLAHLVLLGLFAISFQNASQHYDWYWDPRSGAPGYVDTWTHMTSPWLIGALVAPLALERYLGWERRFMWFIVFSVIAVAALSWEIGETINVYSSVSSSYFNLPLDSLKDIIMGAGIGTVLSCWTYERLVMDLKYNAADG
jgi:hypothetical protein